MLIGSEVFAIKKPKMIIAAAIKNIRISEVLPSVRSDLFANGIIIKHSGISIIKNGTPSNKSNEKKPLILKSNKSARVSNIKNTPIKIILDKILPKQLSIILKAVLPLARLDDITKAASTSKSISKNVIKGNHAMRPPICIIKTGRPKNFVPTLTINAIMATCRLDIVFCFT